MADLQELARAALTEWLDCSCPYGPCAVYPHPAIQALAKEVGWQPPRDIQPWPGGDVK
jgi:hypothetical protein